MGFRRLMSSIKVVSFVKLRLECNSGSNSRIRAIATMSRLMGIVQSKAGFYVARFFLGFVEGGLFPGVVFYLSMWYVRKERQFRIAMFFSAAALAGAFGGILAYGIAFMDGVGGLGGWRWIFILEGILTFVVGCLAYFFIVNYPDTAKFLKPAERSFIQKRLHADSDSAEIEGFTWTNVLAAFKDPKVWLYCTPKERSDRRSCAIVCVFLKQISYLLISNL